MVSTRKRSAAAAKSTEGLDAAELSPGDDIKVLAGDSDVISEVETAYNPSGSELEEHLRSAKAAKRKKVRGKSKREAEVEEDVPAVNSSYVPIPWRGRLGYACLNTYLRTCDPPIFCSRSCRIDTILKQGAWETKGLEYVQALGLANAKDLVKLIHWNEKYGIKFLRISSQMFPFASHAKYGYNLDFAREALGEAGRVAMEFGHRLTAHPGQFTQLGSPRKEVIEASVKDLEYHSQLLRGLVLSGQADKDAVMVLHMGGMFGDRKATLERFKRNYEELLSEDVKARLVLENDDVIWSVEDLLPICEELNLPLVLDYHHHNIIHDPSLRKGTLDVMKYFPQIKQTWTRKGITQKQHYSEPCPGAVTGRDTRKHSPRVAVLPPCEDTMDLMIEAKDKEQAVFGLYRKYNIGPRDNFEQVIPHERTDDNRAHLKKQKSTKKRSQEEPDVLDAVALIPQEEIGMGGDQRRVYWLQGHEHWLSPPKRPVKRKEKVAEEETEVAAKKCRKRAAGPPADQNEAPVKGTGGKAVKTAPAVDVSSKKGGSNTEEIAPPKAQRARQRARQTKRAVVPTAISP